MKKYIKLFMLTMIAILATVVTVGSTSSIFANQTSNIIDNDGSWIMDDDGSEYFVSEYGVDIPKITAISKIDGVFVLYEIRDSEFHEVFHPFGNLLWNTMSYQRNNNGYVFGMMSATPSSKNFIIRFIPEELMDNYNPKDYIKKPELSDIFETEDEKEYFYNKNGTSIKSSLDLHRFPFNAVIYFQDKTVSIDAGDRLRVFGSGPFFSVTINGADINTNYQPNNDIDLRIKRIDEPEQAAKYVLHSYIDGEGAVLNPGYYNIVTDYQGYINFYETNSVFGTSVKHIYSADEGTWLELKDIAQVRGYDGDDNVYLEPGWYEIDIDEQSYLRIFKSTGYHGDKIGNPLFANDTRVTIVFGPFIDRQPAIDGLTVINDVDNPFTLEQVLDIADIVAYDPYFGDITEDLEIVVDNYTANKKVVGTFAIKLSVTNQVGLTATFTLNVINKDFVKPEIIGPGVVELSYTKSFDLTEFLSKYTVTDNHDEDVKLLLNSSNVINKVPGTYQIKLSATDSSLNKTEKTITFKIIDDIAPVFTDTLEGLIEVNWNEHVTNAALLYGLYAKDFIDGDIHSINIVENNIKSKIGTYTVKYEAKDKSGNTSIHIRSYKVVNTDLPVFLVSKHLILMSVAHTLTADQLAKILADYHKIDMASYSVVINDYEGNENKIGIYSISLDINDTKGDVHSITTYLELLDETPEVELSTWEKIIKGFKDFWNIITWPIIKIGQGIVWVFNLLTGWIR